MSLARKAAGATAWVAGTTYLNQGITFLANVALMRLIAPDAFGVLALAVFFSTLGRKVVAFGFNHALIHKQDELPTAIGSHLLLHLASAVIVIAGSVLAFPLVAAHYDRLTAAVLIGVCVGAAFESAGNTPRILLEKEVEFRGLLLVNLGVNVGVSIVSVLGAWIWPNVWVLLFRLATTELACMIGYWRINPRPPMAKPTWDMIRWYIRFGTPLWLGGIATLAVLQFDDFLVGTLISAKELGYYNRAYALAVLPTTMVTHIVARVAFPLYSKLQHDREKLSATFGMVVKFIVLVSGPAAFGLAYCAPEFIGVVFGDQWRPMAMLVRLLIIYEVLRPIFDDVGELFTAVGHPRKIGRIQIVQAISVVLFATPAVYFFSSSGAAVAVGLVMAIGVFLAYRDLTAHVTINLWDIFAVPMVCCALATAISALILWHWPIQSEAWRLMAKIAAFGAGTVALIFTFQGRRLIADYRLIKAQLTGKETT